MDQLHPNIIAGALREAVVLLTTSPDYPTLEEAFDACIRTMANSAALAELVTQGVQVPAPNPDPFPAPQQAPAPVQHIPQGQPMPQGPPMQPQPQYAQPTAMPQSAPPAPAQVGPNSSEDELWASLIAEYQQYGRLVNWEDKRASKGPNGKGADFSHTQIQKQNKQGKWWPLGLWLNQRTPGWVYPALQQAGLA